MDRRDFIKNTGTLVAATALSGAKSFAEVDGNRSVLPLNRGWRYHAGLVADAHSAAFNDAGFERVVIPHTNTRLPWHGFDDKEYEFVSTYRRRFRTPDSAKGKRVFLDFEGAMTASTVWINGVSLGEYRGGLYSVLLRADPAPEGHE